VVRENLQCRRDEMLCMKVYTRWRGMTGSERSGSFRAGWRHRPAKTPVAGSYPVLRGGLILVLKR